MIVLNIFHRTREEQYRAPDDCFRCSWQTIKRHSVTYYFKFPCITTERFYFCIICLFISLGVFEYVVYVNYAVKIQSSLVNNGRYLRVEGGGGGCYALDILYFLYLSVQIGIPRE